MTRLDPPQSGDERAMLVAYLQYHRETLRTKAGGLDAAQLDTALAPSDMTLGGMVKHLALVEDWWFRCILLGLEHAEPWASVDWDADADWDWHSAKDDTSEQLWSLYEANVTAADAAYADVDLDTLSIKAGRSGEPFSLRWILLHMIEEYARHNGHADLIRQSIDGQTGE